ncbi:unnamed protein product, partial [Meganyctiphanes norvegica]
QVLDNHIKSSFHPRLNVTTSEEIFISLTFEEHMMPSNTFEEHMMPSKNSKSIFNEAVVVTSGAFVGILLITNIITIILCCKYKRRSDGTQSDANYTAVEM